MKINIEELLTFSKSLKVLVVEDNQEVREQIIKLLENFFDDITNAIDGVDALEKFNNDNFDLIITDINMPRMDGCELIKNIKEINHEQVIIVVSAYNDSEILIKLIQEGVSNFLMKPIKTNSLIEILYKNCKSISNQKKQNEYLIQQAKLAQMGEMMDIIAHQWKQPLGVLKMRTLMLELDNNSDELNKDMINEYIKKHNLNMELLMNTIDEFRNFFKENNKIEFIKLKDLLKSTLLLTKDNLIKHTIDTDINCSDDIMVKVISNEFKHILINLITNAIEAFEENNIISNKRKMVFDGKIENDKVILTITDNAGGIPLEIIDKIFNQHFTTKETGTGVGLYLSTKILDKVGGSIKVENIKDGAVFKIELCKNI